MTALLVKALVVAQYVQQRIAQYEHARTFAARAVFLLLLLLLLCRVFAVMPCLWTVSSLDRKHQCPLSPAAPVNVNRKSNSGMV